MEYIQSDCVDMKIHDQTSLFYPKYIHVNITLGVSCKILQNNFKKCFDFSATPHICGIYSLDFKK